MASTRAKGALYDQVARIAKAVSSPKRLELLELLGQGEKRVEALAAAADLEVKNTSAHLRALRNACLVQARKDGVNVYYRLADEAIGEFLIALRSLAERRLAELRELVREHFSDPEGTTPLGGRELLARVRRGEVTVIDVRPQDEYRAGHIPGARSIPLAELKRRLGTLPRRREVVAYCRGQYCFMAVDAVALLRRHGFRAVRLADGVAEWRAAGLPVETGIHGEDALRSERSALRH